MLIVPAYGNGNNWGSSTNLLVPRPFCKMHQNLAQFGASTMRFRYSLDKEVWFKGKGVA